MRRFKYLDYEDDMEIVRLVTEDVLEEHYYPAWVARNYDVGFDDFLQHWIQDVYAWEV